MSSYLEQKVTVALNLWNKPIVSQYVLSFDVFLHFCFNLQTPKYQNRNKNATWGRVYLYLRGNKGFSSLQDESLNFHSMYLSSYIAEVFKRVNQKIDDRQMKSLISKKKGIFSFDPQIHFAGLSKLSN